MKDITELKLKKKIKNRGYFAEVVIEVDVLGDGHDIVISFDSDVEPHIESIVFGLRYSYECCTRINYSNKIRVTVLSFNYVPIDTTYTCVSFVAAKVLSKALKVEIEGLSLDADTGHFIFPNP